MRNDYKGRFFGSIEYLLGQSVVAFVTAGNAAESPVVWPRVCEAPRDDHKAVGDLVFGKIKVFARHGSRNGRHGAVIGVQTPSSHARFHVHAVEAIKAKAVAQSEAQYGHNLRVIEEVAKGFSPLQKARPIRRAAKSLRFARWGQFLLVK